MGIMFDDDLFDAQWLRAAGHAHAGGAEIGECVAAAKRIRARNADSWYAAWHEVARHVLAEAQTSKAAGRDISAHGAYLRASNYFRAAYTFLFCAPIQPRLVETYREHIAAFAAAIALRNPPGEAIEIPYEGTHLKGYFLRAATDGASRPTLIVNGGYDSTAEECYLFSGAAALARGYNVLLFDGPGQGGALIEDRLVFRPDWEAVIKPVVDYAIGRPEVDPSRIALLGISFGGYLAPRGASGEPRIAALIADPGEFSLFEEMKSRMPAFAGRGLENNTGWVLFLLRAMLDRRRKSLSGGWGLRRGLLVHGVNDPLAYLRLTADYTLADRIDKIRCPALICSAENDEIGITARRLYDALGVDKRFIAFTASEGAGDHCEMGARSLFNQRAFDWLDEWSFSGVSGYISAAGPHQPGR